MALLFGALALTWTGLTLVTLVYLWGAYALVDGVLALVAGFQMKDGGKPMWPLLLVGIAGIAAGILTFLYPGVTALVLLLIIAGWAIAAGLLQIVAAIRFRKEIDNEWWLLLAGVVSVLFGVAMIARPGAGALALVRIIGLFAAVYGILLLSLAWRLRRLTKRVGPGIQAARA